jgi:hypothetical protein
MPFRMTLGFGVAKREIPYCVAPFRSSTNMEIAKMVRNPNAADKYGLMDANAAFRKIRQDPSCLFTVRSTVNFARIR